MEIDQDVLKQWIRGVSSTGVSGETLSMCLYRVVSMVDMMSRQKLTSDIRVPSIASIVIFPANNTEVSVRMPSIRLLPYIFGK